ncbi:zinc finger CCCH domain-containing protein 14-like [Rhopilema esculentum]|uniref:zinc finger CCCH domain-containing protein 14-like n=1 Tax=Rhopilema esculentum TaxID=499914 RepID=UPI0031D0BF2B
MDLGSEISHKFKASIKRKLKECGTYIDDELPEYIMVMIANKRKSQQMVDDLSLFLGEETDGFVKWLFQTLGKLQSAAQDAVEDDHIKESETRESCEAEPDHGIENTAQVDQTGKEVKENINEGEKPSIDRKEKSRKDKSREDNDGKRKEAEKEKNDESIEIETKSDNKVIAEKIHEDTRSEVRKRRQDFVLSRKTSESVTGKKDRNEENKKDSTKKRRLSSSKTEAIDKIAAEKDNSDHGHAESLQSAVAMQKIRPSLPRSRQATGLLVKKAIKEANQSVTVKPRKQSASEGQLEVAASSAENKVERRVHLKRGRSNVSESEPLEEKEEDVEADFENEESVGKKKKTGEPDKHQEDGIEVEVVENEFLEEEKEPKLKFKKRIVIANRGSEDEDDNGDKIVEAETNKEQEKENCLGQSEGSLNSENVKEDVKCDDDHRREKLDLETKRERRKKRHRRDRSTHSKERRRGSPKFVVTLHGALDSRIKAQRKRKHYLSKDDYDHPMFVDLHPKEPLEILESAQKEIEKMAHQLDLMQNIAPTSMNDPFNTLLPGPTTLPALSSVLTSVTRPIFQEALPVLPGNNGLMLSSVNPTQQVFTGVLPLQTPVMMVPKPQEEPVFAGNKQLGREIVIPLHDEKDELMYEDDEGDDNNSPTEEEQPETILERCKFWPNCKNASCLYVHPSKPCRTFPNCNFKEKCIFVHPMCKFDGRCSNSSCPYNHSLKSSPFLQYSSKAFGREAAIDSKPPKPICKFVPNCTRSNCPFRHPISKPCRYGSGCKRINCPFHHETRPAKKEDLKWSSTARSTEKHISERIFAAGDGDVTEAPVSLTAQ